MSHLTLSYYTVMQWVPDPIAGEYINIGLIAFDHSGISSEFIKSFDRVHAFDTSDLSYLIDLINRLRIAHASGLFVPGEVYAEASSMHDRMLRIQERYINSVQFSKLRPSLLSRQAVLEELATTFLKS